MFLFVFLIHLQFVWDFILLRVTACEVYMVTLDTVQSPTMCGLSGAEPKPEGGVGRWGGHQDVGVLHIDGIYRTHWAGVALTLQLLHELKTRREKIRENTTDNSRMWRTREAGCETRAGRTADLPILSFPHDDTTVWASRDEMPLRSCNIKTEEWINP